jgi:hypothetical protein
MPEDAKAEKPEKPEKAATADEAADRTKDSFREALERKRAQRHPHEGASQSGGKAQHEHGAVGGKRTFRRKSG